MFEKIRARIAQYDKIIIYRHKNPDGDAIGSQVGLKHLILENYPHKTVYCVGDEPRRYAFIKDSAPDVITDKEYEGALAVILDLSAPELITDDRYKLAAEAVRIDHHIFIAPIAEDEVIDTDYEGLLAHHRACHGGRLGHARHCSRGALHRHGDRFGSFPL